MPILKEPYHYSFKDVPMNRDIFLMQEKWLNPYEQYIEDVYRRKAAEPVGYVSYAAVRSISDDHLEISWYPNISDRFHEVFLRLPISKFICWVEHWRFDEKPIIFVSDDWIDDLYKRTYSVFALIDAIGVKDALRAGKITEHKLLSLRNALDKIADSHPKIAVISFADSVLVKSDWTVGAVDNELSYTYSPESLIDVIEIIFSCFKQHINLSCYACITQGFNEYADGKLIHSSSCGNHVSLNSLGLPFAQLMNIDQAVHCAIKSGTHDPHELYLDANYYSSLQWIYEFDRNGQAEGNYISRMSNQRCKYFCLDLALVRANLRSKNS